VKTTTNALNILALAGLLTLPVALGASAQQRPMEPPTGRPDQPRPAQPMDRDRTQPGTPTQPR
jgi:hypothetical protein